VQSGGRAAPSPGGAGASGGRERAQLVLCGSGRNACRFAADDGRASTTALAEVGYRGKRPDGLAVATPAEQHSSSDDAAVVLQVGHSESGRSFAESLRADGSASASALAVIVDTGKRLGGLAVATPAGQHAAGDRPGALRMSSTVASLGLSRPPLIPALLTGTSTAPTVSAATATEASSVTSSCTDRVRSHSGWHDQAAALELSEPSLAR
jgi:hypothetical protein